MQNEWIKRLALWLAYLAAAVCAIFLAIWLYGMATATRSQADGCNPETQDCGRIAEPRQRRSIAYTYSLTPEIIRKRGGSKCGRNIPVWECERVMARIRAEDQRRARAVAKRQPLPRREARDSYRDDRGRKVIVIDDADRRRDRRDRDAYREDQSRCKRRISATSKPHATAWLACFEARKLWSIRAIEEHGGRFGRVDKARGVESDPHPFHEGAWRKVCTFSAIPCASERAE